MQHQIERIKRAEGKLAYAALHVIKKGLKAHIHADKTFFGFLRNGHATAAYMKSRLLAKIFGNEIIRNSVTYVCSGNIPAYYCSAEKERGVRIIVNQNGVYYPGWYPGDYRRANEINLAGQYRIANYIIYQSQFCKQSAAKYLGSPQCAHEVLYNPIDTEVFTPDYGKAHDVDAPIFLATGNFYSAEKYLRLKFALDSFKIVKSKYSNAKMILAGMICKELEQKIGDEMGSPGIVRMNTYRYQDAPQIYRMADIYINTQFNDVCPSAVLEAMSTGLPIVYLDCGGTPELVDGGGIGVPVERSYDNFQYPEPETYAEAMMEGMRRQSALAQEARKRCVEIFDIKIWRKRHEEIFQLVQQ
jgi:glycosyltransferase involved in cell wall biosynthesis